MKRLFPILLPLLLFFTSESFAQQDISSDETAPEAQKEKIADLLNRWHRAAGEADFDTYFSLMAEDAVFIGTDPTENWVKPDFMEWSRPYFERGRAWDFTTIERNIFTAEDCELAWFDELLDTQMGICRGSGVVVKEDGNWKIKHYVLSIAIPNENVEEVTNLKSEFDRSLISKLKSE